MSLGAFIQFFKNCESFMFRFGSKAYEYMNIHGIMKGIVAEMEEKFPYCY